MSYNTRFYLKSPKSKADSLVMGCFTFNNQYFKDNKKLYTRIRFSTEQRITVKFWVRKNQRAKETEDYPYSEFNTRLVQIKYHIEENIYRKTINKGLNPDPVKIKEEIDIYFKRRTEAPPETFLAFIERFSNNAKVTDKGKPISPLTIKKYNNTLNILKEFEKHQKKTIQLKDIDNTFYSDFLSFLQTVRKFSLNTCGKQIKVLKYFIRKAMDAGQVYDLRRLEKFTAPNENTDKAYLTLHDITKLHELYLKEGIKSRIRDLFICACLTGLRYSDLDAIRKENVIELEGTKYLEVSTFKTGEKVVIPLHPIAIEILNRNNYTLRNYSNQVMNREIKVLCQDAKISEVISIQESIAGKRVIRTDEKSEFITTHSARRSFATNAFLSGLSAHDIMPITGHKTEKAFLAYIRSDSKANAIKLKDSSFFQGKTPMKVVNQ